MVQWADDHRNDKARSVHVFALVISLGAGDWMVCRPSDCLVDGSVRTLKNNLKTTSRSFR